MQASIKSTGPGLYGDVTGDAEGSSHLHFLLVTLAGVAVVFLAVCVTIFIVWWR